MYAGRVLLFLAVSVALCLAGDAPAPRFPDIPEVQSIEDLLPGVRTVLKRYDMEEIKSGSSVLIVTDRSLDPRLAEAFQKYAVQAGANVDVVVLNGFPEERDPMQLWERWGQNWWPQWLWKATVQYDDLINLTYLIVGSTYQEGQAIRSWFDAQGVRAALNARPSVEILAYRPFTQFPEELMAALNRKVIDTIPRGRVQVHLTTPDGTDLWLDNDYTGVLKQLLEGGVPSYSMQVSALPNQFKNARGKLVTSTLNVGVLQEPVTLWIENSKVRRVEGGKGLASYLTRTFERLDSVEFGADGRPGLRWLDEITFTTHPKQFGLKKEGDSFSGLFDNWKGAHYRSGAIHISLGASGPAPTHGINKRYRFVFELYFPTLVVGGRKLIDNGHLLVLEDGEVRDVAARFGSPEEWLTEAWIPAVPGINVP